MSKTWRGLIVLNRCRKRYIVKRLDSQAVRCSPLSYTDERDTAYAVVYWRRKQRKALHTTLEEDVHEWRRRLR